MILTNKPKRSTIQILKKICKQAIKKKELEKTNKFSNQNYIKERKAKKWNIQKK